MVCLPGFDIVRRDRSVNGRHGGGVCIYIQSSLNYKVRNDLQSHILENLIVEIIKPRSKSILHSKKSFSYFKKKKLVSRMFFLKQEISN